jgi:hypothetical protein
LGPGGVEEDKERPTTPPLSVLLSFSYSGCLMLVFVMGNSGILLLQKDVIGVLNEKIYDVKQGEIAQRVEN